MDAETEVGGNLKRILILAAFALAVRADTYYVTVAGLGGESEYEQRFAAWAKDLDKVLKAEPGAKVETLSGAEATKANIEAKLRTIAGQAKADDQVVLMLIGHGTWDDRDYKFALPGPDISAAELATLLDRIQARELVVDMTTSSGGRDSLPPETQARGDRCDQRRIGKKQRGGVHAVLDRGVERSGGGCG